MMGLENPLHIVILLVILLLVFGAKRLPEMGRGLGAGMRDFKDALSGDHKSESSETTPAPQLNAHTADVPAAPTAAVPQPAAESNPDPDRQQSTVA